jgi:RimJ/RimL family protein N-acetyltransferase
MDVPVPFLPEHAADFVGAHAELQWSSRRGAPFAITASNGDQVLGSCGLVAIDAGDLVAQVVCGVDPAARGRKVARRAGRLLCDWALKDVGFARLEFYIEPTNAASRAVAVHLGWQLEGILRSKSLIRGTWEISRSTPCSDETRESIGTTIADCTVRCPCARPCRSCDRERS